MSMLETQEGEITISQKWGGVLAQQPDLIPAASCGLSKARQPGRQEKQEGHIWRDVHEAKEVVTCLLSFLPNCWRKAGIAMFIHIPGYSLVYINCMI